MLTKCANPKCDAIFHRLGEGRLFEVNFDEEELRRKSGVSGEVCVMSPDSRGVERYWLCAECAQTMTLVVNRRTNRVMLVPLSAESFAAQEAKIVVPKAPATELPTALPPQSALAMRDDRLAVS